MRTCKQAAVGDEPAPELLGRPHGPSLRKLHLAVDMVMLLGVRMPLA